MKLNSLFLPRFNSPIHIPPLPSHRTNLLLLLHTKTSPTMSSSSSSSSKIIAEYARSGRSSCKGCSTTIASATLRLGLVTKDPRGYDTTKWYHLNCFPKKSQNPISVDAINGYALLKPDDQQALRNFASLANNEVEDEGTVKETPLKKVKSLKRKGGEEKEVGAVKEVPLKKVKGLSNSGGEGEEEGAIKEGSLKKLKVTEIGLSETDVKSDYKGIELAPKWKSFQTVIFLEKDEGLKDSSKIAAFDFDGCLAKTSVKKPGAEAWSLMFKTIPEKLKELYEEGYKVVIFTNEANIERWKNKRAAAIESKIGRLNGFIEKVKIPVQVFIACGYGGDDVFRKPNVGMWRLMEKYFNSGIKVDMDESFYVGDAAGRGDDHGDADSKFAETIGLKFHLPEDYFSA